MVLPAALKEYNLDVKARHERSAVYTSVKLLQSQELSWEVVAQLPMEGPGVYHGNRLAISCSIARNMEIRPSEVTYTIKKIYHEPPPLMPNSESWRASGLTWHQLMSMDPHKQKQIIGEHIYRKIYNMYPQLAGKITGTGYAN